jgi:hypothetical protein
LYFLLAFGSGKAIVAARQLVAQIPGACAMKRLRQWWKEPCSPEEGWRIMVGVCVVLTGISLLVMVVAELMVL